MQKKYLSKRSLIKSLKEGVRECDKYGVEPDARSLGYQEGVLISRNEAAAILELLKQTKPCKTN